MAGKNKDNEDKRAKFLRVYANIPDKLREDIIAIINGKTYTWNAAYIEIKNITELGKEILKELEVTNIL